MEKRIKEFYGVSNNTKKYAEMVYNDFVHFLTNQSHDRFYNVGKDIKDYIPDKFLEGIDIRNGLNNKKYYNLYLNLFLIFKLTKYKYNLNEVEELMLEENFSEAIKNHSTLVKTEDSDYCVYRDSKKMYTLEIDKEFIAKIKVISNFKINKKSSINLGMDIYNFYNHPIFKEDVKLNSNNDIIDIISLAKYTKNMDLINRYLKLLNTDDKQYKKLLLEFIKPISEDIIFDNNSNEGMCLYSSCLNDGVFLPSFNYFIRNDNMKNELDKCLKYYKYYNINMNIYCLKLFENYFISKINELEIISNLEDRCDAMASLIKFKNSIIKNVYNVDDEFNQIDFDIKKCDQLKEEFDNIFKEIINIKEYKKNKVKVKDGVYV